MKYLDKKDKINLIVLIIGYLLFVLFLTKFKFLYGSTTDWASQHYLIPEYFRNLFYSTGKILPNFSFNLGSGQNIFNFAYYGFLSPIVLISYFFPFIKMVDYIMISSVLIVIVSFVLFYIWLRKNGYKSNICFYITTLFLLASPLIFHSHRHIMFISYLPFLILALMGVDKYFLNNKKTLLIISVFLIILTSYFYSVGAIICILIYGIYKYLKINDKITFKSFMIDGFKFIYPIIIGILLAGFFLLPILHTLLGGRDNNVFISSLDLIKPNFNLNYYLYNSYSVGLCSIVIFALVGIVLLSKKENKFLGITFLTIMIFPIFNYLLNGTLYINSKSLIPFLPLLCLVILIFIQNLKKINLKYELIITLLIIIVFLIFNNYKYSNLLIIDMIITSIGLLIYKFKNNKYFIFIPTIFISFIVLVFTNMDDNLVKIKDYNNSFSKDYENLITTTLNKDKDYYRFSNQIKTLDTINKVYDKRFYKTTMYSSIYNRDYNNFFYNVINNEVVYRNSVITNSSLNILSNMLLGEKYMISNSKVGVGYILDSQNDKAAVYKNDFVLPIGYATSRLLSNEDYNKLSYPYNVDALLNYGVVKKGNTNYVSNVSKKDIDYKVTGLSNLAIDKEDDKYYINASSDAYLKMDVETNDEILIISFKMGLSQSCSQGDTYITINNISNKLTCKSWKYHNNNYNFEYVISADKIDSLDIKFGKGKYIISDIKTYTMDFDKIKNINRKVDPFKIEKMEDDEIKGHIDVKNDGYFILSIPYDEGFKIKVNDKYINYEKVNDSFIGFKINKGSYDIDIVYEAPLLKIGFILSLIGLILLLIDILRKRV